MKLTILCALAAGAAMGAAAAIPPAYQAHLPPEHHWGAIDYRSGGTDRAEADSLKRAALEYPLEVVFREQDRGGRHAVANTPITITDANGKVVFTGPTQGPYFLVRLPAGRYTVTATWDAWTFSRPVTINPGDRERVVFEWKKLPGETVVASAETG